MPGLPFDELPAHVVGRGIAPDGRQVDLQRLFNTNTGQEEDMIVENGVMSPAGSRPAGHTGRWVEQAPTSTPQAPTGAQTQAPTAASNDPFATLDQLQQTAMAPLMATFDQQEQMLKGQMGGIKNDLTKLYEVEAAGVSQLGLDAQQLQRRYQQLQTKYKLAYAKQSSEFEPAIQEVTAKRQTAMAEVQAKFAATRIKQNTYQEMIDDGTITPEEGRKRQFAAMGVNYDSPDPPTPKERLAELRQYQTALTDVMLNTRRNKKGNIEEYMGSAGSPEWEVVPPDRAAEIEKTWQVNNGIVDEIERVATAAGVKMGLADTGRTAMAPAKKTGLAAIGNLIKRSPAAKAFEASGYRLQRPGLFRPMITRTPVAKPLTKELATELRNKGMTREQVEQWAKENGYAI